jgi:hypothetical protein
MTLLYGAYSRGSSRIPTSNIFHGPDVDNYSESSKRRCVERF